MIAKRQMGFVLFVRIVGSWFVYAIIVAYVTSWCVTRLLFAAESDDRVVTAATLHRLIESNTVVNDVASTSTSPADDNTYYHPTYDFDEDRIKLLAVTSRAIRVVACYERPKTTKHARFVKSWRDLKRVCESANEWPPPLEDLIDVIDRRVVANVVQRDVRATISRRSLIVSVASSRGEPTVITYSYENEDDVLRLTLPLFLDADVVTDDVGRIKIRLRVKSPCSHPDVVTYEDFRRYYVARRAIASPPPLDVAKRNVVLSRFRWRCNDDNDLDPTLVPVDTN